MISMTNTNASPMTTGPIELDGWYEHTDGTFGFYVGAARAGGPTMTQGPCAAADCVKRDETGAIYETGWPARLVESTYRIQTDEETGGDDVWDALHDYADAHPAPAVLAQFVCRTAHGNFNGVVVDEAAGIAAIAWLEQAALALGWDERTTPVLVIPETEA